MLQLPTIDPQILMNCILKVPHFYTRTFAYTDAFMINYSVQMHNTANCANIQIHYYFYYFCIRVLLLPCLVGMTTVQIIGIIYYTISCISAYLMHKFHWICNSILHLHLKVDYTIENEDTAIIKFCFICYVYLLNYF